MIQIKRVYGKRDHSEGYRILIDRLWPRGVSKKEAHIDLWLKEIAPSTELRTWFNHDPEKWDEFEKLYKKELKEKEELVEKIRALEKEKGNVTLLYAAKDESHNNAVVLRDLLK